MCRQRITTRSTTFIQLDEPESSPQPGSAGAAAAATSAAGGGVAEPAADEGVWPSKINRLLALVRSWPADEKFIIFSSFPSTLTLICEALNAGGFKTAQFDGMTNMKKGSRLLSEFQVLFIAY